MIASGMSERGSNRTSGQGMIVDICDDRNVSRYSNKRVVGTVSKAQETPRQKP